MRRENTSDRRWFQVCALCGLVVWSAGASPVSAVPWPSGSRSGVTNIDVLRLTVEGELERLRQSGDSELATLVRRFYDDRGYSLVWLDGDARRAASELLRRIAAAGRDGLCPLPYNATHLRVALAAVPSREPAATAQIAELDVSVTTTMLQYLMHLGLGRDATRDRRATRRSVDIVAALRRIREIRDTGAVLTHITPRHFEYHQLVWALERYRAIARRGGWRPLPPASLLRPGAPAPTRVLERLAVRLRATGDLGPSSVPAGVVSYSAPLVDAVRAFQARHGLAVDGIVGPATVRAMNVPVARRIAQIAVNMDRWRRLPDDLGDRHVRVRIPWFRLAVLESGREVLQLRAIVGRPSTATPSFSDRIRYIEFNPYWNVPASIAASEILPKAAADPGYLEARGFEVLAGWHPGAERLDPSGIDWEEGPLRYRIRQIPGPANALGRVKFMFPNRYSVYLHDTPARRLFDARRRAFSHGCVRVEEPASLAAALLQDQDGWTGDRVVEAMNSRARRVEPLPRPVPIHLLYLTVSVDATGLVHFREDLYGRDQRAWPRPRASPRYRRSPS